MKTKNQACQLAQMLLAGSSRLAVQQHAGFVTTTCGESAASHLLTGVCHPIKCGPGLQAQVSMLQGLLEML
jgi:hypothetical protein